MRVFRIKPIGMELPVAPIGETIPATAFSLSQFEQLKYDILHYQQEELEKIPSELSSSELKNIEESIQELFLDLTRTYLHSRGVEAPKCSIYDRGKKALLQTPFYSLYDNNDPFCIGLRVNYTFSLQQELSCTSSIEYKAPTNFPERDIVYDVLQRCVEVQRPDSLNVPKIYRKDNLLYFVSADLALTLIDALEAALQKIGLPAMRELHELYHESTSRPDLELNIPPGFSPVSSGIFRKKAFREAYEHGLESVLNRSGLRFATLAQSE